MSFNGLSVEDLVNQSFRAGCFFSFLLLLVIYWFYTVSKNNFQSKGQEHTLAHTVYKALGSERTLCGRRIVEVKRRGRSVLFVYFRLHAAPRFFD